MLLSSSDTTSLLIGFLIENLKSKFKENVRVIFRFKEAKKHTYYKISIISIEN